jgi:hypothetical protein
MGHNKTKHAFQAIAACGYWRSHCARAANGRLLMVNLTSADVQDTAGAEAIVAVARKRWPWLKHLFAIGAAR